MKITKRIIILYLVAVICSTGCSERRLLKNAKEGNGPAVKALLKKGVDPNTTDRKTGWSALHLAAYSGNVAVISALLESSANLNTKNKRGYTPLWIAIDKGKCDAVKMLLNKSADSSTTDSEGNSPLLFAIIQNNTSAGLELLNRGAKADAANLKGISALHLSILKKNKELLQSLIQHGADVNLVSSYEQTSGTQTLNLKYAPLHVAVSVGMIEGVEMLIAAGAKVDQTIPVDKTNLFATPTPLKLAKYKGNLNLAKLLYKHGANIHVKDEYGFTLLHVAADGPVAIIEWLVALGLDVNARAAHGRTPLYLAAYGGNDAAVELLLRHGANPNLFATVNGQPVTPEMAARGKGHLKTAEIIRNWGKAPIISTAGARIWSNTGAT